MSTAYENSMEDVLTEIVRARGISALQDGKILTSMFRDLSGEKRDQRIVQYFTECGGHTALLEAGALSPAMQKARFHQVISKMCNETLVNEPDARQVCNAFWSAVYGSPLEVLPTSPRQQESRPAEGQTTAESAQNSEVKIENALPKKKKRLPGWVIGMAVCGWLLLICCIGMSDRNVNPEYTTLFSRYGFEDHRLDFKGKETLAYARGISDLGFTVREFVFQDGIVEEEILYAYRPFSEYWMGQTEEAREECVALLAQTSKKADYDDAEDVTIDYLVLDDYYVLITRFKSRDFHHYDKEFIENTIKFHVAAQNGIAREMD